MGGLVASLGVLCMPTSSWENLKQYAYLLITLQHVIYVLCFTVIKWHLSNLMNVTRCLRLAILMYLSIPRINKLLSLIVCMFGKSYISGNVCVESSNIAAF